MLVEIFADFNAQTEDGNIRLSTNGSKRDIAKHTWKGGSPVGHRIFICDGEIGAVAEIMDVEGILEAKIIDGPMDVTT